MSENYPFEGSPCPECGDTLLAGVIELKQNRKTMHHFYGCSSWPHCEWTLDPGEADEDDEFMAKYEWVEDE